MGEHGPSSKLSRRMFLRASAIAAAAPAVPALVGAVGATGEAGAAAAPFPHEELREATIAGLRAQMDAGRLTARALVQMYIDRIAAIDQSGPTLRAVIELNPDALAIADALDAERQAKGPRSPLHGMPILIKDNIDTADKMLTAAGSLALVGSRPTQDATVARKLREAGAIIIGKTNLSEWANFRSTHATSGWSGRGRQTRNPYLLTHNPCGSSSGSGVAVSANLCVGALATETDGSIVCPAHQNGVVGIKPTLGLTSRAGVVPIAHSQDTVGTHARTVIDAALLLGALTGVDARDSATAASAGKGHADYTPFLDPNGLRGARIGVARKTFFGYSAAADAIIEAAIARMRDLGATIVDPADLPNAEAIAKNTGETEVLLYEFKADLNAYLATRVKNERFPQAPFVRTLAEAIAFNDGDAQDELPYFGQELFLQAQEKGPLTEQAYRDALAQNRRLGGTEGLDAALDAYKLDALIAPTGQPAWPTDLRNGDHFLGASSSPAAIAGYPLVTVPAGYAYGLPVGITFMGRAWSEPTLIKLAYAFEQGTKARRVPQFLASDELP